jgi:hypothetical protein
VVSDPFPEADGIAVHVTKKRLKHSHTADSGDSASECKREETPLAPSSVESARVQRWEKVSMDKSRDQDRGKGATEQDPQNQGGNTSMQGQLGHRDEDAELKNADSDLSG